MNLGSAFGLSSVAPMLGGTALAMGDTIAQGAFSARQASNQMNFQREMSDTAFQRRALDLSAAGLNPILAATQGPAGVPTGAMASTPSSSAASSFFSAANAANSLAQARKTNADATVSETEAEVARRRLRALGTDDEPRGRGLIGSLPSSLQPSAKAAAEGLRGAADAFFDLFPDGSSEVGRMLRGGSGASSARSAVRSSGVDVSPGGAFVGNTPRMGGQLGRLRSKALERGLR